MNLDECLQRAMTDARNLVDKGYWVKIQTYKASILLDFGVIHDDNSLECSLITKLYIVEVEKEKV